MASIHLAADMYVAHRPGEFKQRHKSFRGITLKCTTTGHYHCRRCCAQDYRSFQDRRGYWLVLSSLVGRPSLQMYTLRSVARC